jgi:DNA-binding XRE family transcriptional regulator
VTRLVLTQVFYCLPGYTRMDYFGREGIITITCEVLMTTRQRKQSQFGARLFLFRRQAHLSREELACRSGTSAHSIQSWEQGRAANPTLRAVFRLAQALGVTVRALLEGVDVDFEDPGLLSRAPATDSAL